MTDRELFQQSIREAFENAVDTYHIYGEESLVKHCEKQVDKHFYIAQSLLWAYELNCKNKGKNIAWASLTNEFDLRYLERIAIRYFGYDPKDHIHK